MLVMIKPSGIIFVGGVCLVYLVYEYIGAGLHRTLRYIGRLMRIGGVVVSVPLIELGICYLVLYGVHEDFYDNYYWFFADGLSNAKEQDEKGHCQAYKVIRDEITNEFCWFEPVQSF